MFDLFQYKSTMSGLQCNRNVILEINVEIVILFPLNRSDILSWNTVKIDFSPYRLCNYEN